MEIQLSDHFTYSRLIRFTVPSIIMMIFISIYGVVDGIFVSNFVGKTPFAAVNLIMPFCMLLGAFGFMIGTGGSALVSKVLGEGDKEKANKIFSMLIYMSLAIGIVLTIFGCVFVRPISEFLGAEGEMLEHCVIYGRILLTATAAFILQNEFQSFLITAERPKLGLWITVLAGCVNIVLDALFVAIFKWGLVGAAVATVISQVVGATVPMIYFIVSKNDTLRLTKPEFDGRAFLKTCTNGSSEMMTNVALSLVNILYNFQLIKIAGENGVAAYGVIMYINFIFISVFIGYSIGSAPIISYHFGAENTLELKNLFKKSLVIMGLISLVMTVSGILLSNPLSKIFVGYDKILFEMTKEVLLFIRFRFCL